MRRALILFTILLLFPGAVWLARVPIAQGIAEYFTGSQLPLPVSFDLTRLDTEGMTIEAISIGGEDSADIDRIEIVYSLAGLRENTIEKIEIDGVSVPVTADLVGNIRVAGIDIQPTTGGDDATPALPAWTVGSLTVNGIDIAATIDRTIDVGITGGLHSTAPLDLAALPVGDPVALLNDIAGSLTLTVKAGSDTDALAALPLTNVTAAGNIDMSLGGGTLSLTTHEPVGVRADQGTIDINIALTGSGEVRRIEDLSGAVTAKVSLINIPVADLPGETAFLTGLIVADIADGKAHLRVGRGSSIGVSGLPIGESVWTQPFQDFGVGFTVIKPLTAELPLTGLPPELSVEGDLVATYGPIYVALRGPTRLKTGPDGRKAELATIRVDIQKDNLFDRKVMSSTTINGLEFNLDAFTATGKIETETEIADDNQNLAANLAGRLNLSLQRADFSPEPGGTLSVNSEEMQLDTTVDAADTNNIAVVFDTLKATGDLLLAPFAATFDGSTVSVPKARLALDYADDTATMSITAPALMVDGTAMLAGPIKLDATIEQTEAGNLLDGNLTTEPGLSAEFHAYHTEKVPVIHTVTASVEVAPIVFSEGGLQPSDIFPFLALSGPFNGTVSSRTDLVVDLNKPPTGLISLQLKDGNFRNPIFAFSNISETLELPIERLPGSRPDQMVSGAISAGPLTDAPFRMVYTIHPDLSVDVKEVTVEGFGGSFGLKDLTIGADREAADGTIFLEAVDFEILAETAAIEGLHADGVLSGEIPFSIKGDRLIAPQGRLRALGPGTLTYASPALEATAENDTQMALLVDALKNFHYTALSLETALPENGDGSVLLNLQGYNPDVLDAQPFDLNINLESNFNKLANDLYKMYEQATGFVSRATD